MTQDRSFSRNMRDTMKEKIPQLQNLAISFIDRACCFSYTAPEGFAEYDQDNSIVLLHEEFAPTLVSSGSLSESTKTPEKHETKRTSYVFMDHKSPAEIQLASMGKPKSSSSSVGTAATASSQTKSQGSWASLKTIKTCSTLAWEDFEESVNTAYEGEESNLSSGESSELAIPSQSSTLSSTSDAPRGHVRRWSGVDKDLSAKVIASAGISNFDHREIRRALSESMPELPFLTQSRGYEV